MTAEVETRPRGVTLRYGVAGRRYDVLADREAAMGREVFIKCPKTGREFWIEASRVTPL